ncbi:MAG: conjugal transfer protein TraX [Sulfurovum sp.]|nr:conjugal transfer protein TraX [Sulfurovum sp.]
MAIIKKIMSYSDTLFNKKTSSQIELLKWIGVFAMLADHIGVLFYPSLSELRGVGRLAYPLFGYVLMHNYIFFSQNKSSYIKRLLFLAILSEPLHYLLFQKFYAGLSIFFMYSLVLSFFYVYEGYIKYFNNQKFKNGILIILFLLGISLSIFIEYSIVGFLLLVAFYTAFKKNNTIATFSALFLLYMINYPSQYYSVIALLSFVSVVFIVNLIQIKIKQRKRFFYFFYPVHIILLLLYSSFIN